MRRRPGANKNTGFYPFNALSRKTGKGVFFPELENGMAGNSAGISGHLLLTVLNAAYSSGAMFGSLALAWFSGLQLSVLRLFSRS